MSQAAYTHKCNYILHLIEKTMGDLRLHNFRPVGIIMSQSLAEALKQSVGIPDDSPITCFGLPVFLTEDLKPSAEISNDPSIAFTGLPVLNSEMDGVKIIVDIKY